MRGKFIYIGLLVLRQDLANIKLAAHLKKYDQAHQIILDRNYRSNNPISREEWEELLKFDASDEFTEIELGLLQENQLMIIEANKQAAIKKIRY